MSGQSLVNIIYNQLKHYFPHWTIKVGAGTEAVGLFESIHLFVASVKSRYKMLSVELNEEPVCVRTKW
jgi:hypothetical protein